MNYKHLYPMALLGLCLLFGCKDQSTPDAEPLKADQNMSGLYIPRGLQTQSEGLAPGYLLIPVPNSASFYLINRGGEVVHEWKGDFRALGGYLLDDGSIMGSAFDLDYPVFTAAGGNAGRLNRISWDGKLMWDFEYANEKYLSHHDMAVLPNGNILAIAREEKTAEEVLRAGRNPQLTPKAGLWPDKIVEIVPNGPRGGDIIWEWHIWDHLVQNFDAEQENYGDPAAHPELLDVNLGHPLPEPITQDSLDRLFALGKAARNLSIDNQGADIYHMNAVNYNAELDQIVFSSPHLNEIFIIDHSTTTEEAAGHRGGRRERGGDFLYRWGNPQNYGRGDSTDQKLFYQHDIRWIEAGKPGAGNLTVFNNRVPGGPDSMHYSAVYELAPPMDAAGNYQLLENQRFGPEAPTWQYIAPDTISFFARVVSAAERMENGNTFIGEGTKGRSFEVTPEGEIVWEYLTQYRGEIRKPNGDPIPVIPHTYAHFRSTFIPADHPGLQGRDLSPLDPQPSVFTLPPKEDELQ